MSIRKVNFTVNEFYHLYNRGNSKQKIFHNKEDYFHFMSLMYVCNSKNNFRALSLGKKETHYDFDRGKNIVSIGAYCLMPNHFHILITEKEEGDISKFMQKLSTAYSMYYNKKYERNGGLFEGKFKSQHANTDRYLKYLFSYIHLNPIKLIDKEWREKGIKNIPLAINHLQNYKYSSYSDYLSKQSTQNLVLNVKDFPNYFSTKQVFRKEIFEWLSYKNY